MRMLKIILMVVTVLGTLSGCGGWDQNPLAKFPDFNSPRGEPGRDPGEKPVPTDQLRVTAPNNVATQEGQALEFEVSARILLDDQEYEVSVQIENLDQFAGATFDASKGIFSWTPAIGWIDSVEPGALTQQRSLKIRGIAEGKDRVFVRERTVDVLVLREFSNPEIVEVKGIPSTVREGDKFTFEVFVKDFEASPTERETWPRLLITTAQEHKNLASLIEHFTTQSVGDGRYRFVYQLDASGAELTDSIAKYGMNLVAASRFGRLGTAQSIFAEIYTAFSTPVSTWIEDLNVPVGERIKYQFIIQDPRQEAKLTVSAHTGLPSGSSLKCVPVSMSAQQCEFEWTPTAAQAEAPYDIYITTQSRNRDPRDTVPFERNLKMRARAILAGE